MDYWHQGSDAIAVLGLQTLCLQKGILNSKIRNSEFFRFFSNVDSKKNRKTFEAVGYVLCFNCLINKDFKVYCRQIPVRHKYW